LPLRGCDLAIVGIVTRPVLPINQHIRPDHRAALPTLLLPSRGRETLGKDGGRPAGGSS
jgi:hypothetical protein